MAVDIEVTCVDSEDFSEVEHETELETPEISFDTVDIWELEG